MTLTVEVTPDGSFAPAVQGALRRICPCLSVRVNPTTGVVSVSAMACSCYCDHRAGCNMLSDLVRSGRAIQIVYGGGSSSYINNKVKWYTHDVDYGDRDVCGNTLIPAWLQLAHELVHALQNTTGEGEFAAVRGENQIRLEACLPMRAYYEEAPVPDFRVGVLDNSNRPEYDCDCSIFRGGLCQTLRRFFCALHSMYCLPEAVLSIWNTERSGSPQ